MVWDQLGVSRILDEGIDLVSAENQLDFQGAGVSASLHPSIPGRVVVTISGFPITEGPGCGEPGGYLEIIGGAFPTSIIWYDTPAKMKKIVEKTITRSGGPATLVAPTPVEWKFYAVDGVTVTCTISDAITYTGGVFEFSRVRTIT